MSRRKSAVKREVNPDPIYNDLTVSKFVNRIMYQGKRSVAQGLFYSSLEEIKAKIQGEEPMTVFKKALENCKPSLEVRSRRVGGATYQVPCDVRPTRRLSLAMKWLVLYARDRGEAADKPKAEPAAKTPNQKKVAKQVQDRATNLPQVVLDAACKLPGVKTVKALAF